MVSRMSLAKVAGLLGFLWLAFQSWCESDPSTLLELRNQWLAEFAVFRDSTGVTFWWRTGNENNLIGFDVYHATPSGAWHQVNKDLVISAQSETGEAYQLRFSGSNVGDLCDWRIVAFDSDLRPHESGKLRSKVLAITPPKPARAIPNLSHHITPPVATAVNGEVGVKSVGLAGETRIRMVTREAGMHRVSSSALSALTGTPRATIQERILNGEYAVFNRGHQIAYVPGAGGDDLLFYAESHKDNYTLENTYWLVRGTNLVVTMVDGGSPLPVNNISYRHSLDLEVDSIAKYDLATDPDEDYWFWERLVGNHPLLGQVTLPFVVDRLAPVGEPAIIRIRLKGGTASDHLVTAALNDQAGAGWTASWQGKLAHELVLTVPAGLLEDGTNRLTLRAFGNAMSQVYLDGFSVEYARQFEATNDKIEFNTFSRDSVSINGFSNSAICVFDVSNPREPKLVGNTTIHNVAGRYCVSFVPATTAGRYAVFGERAALPSPRIQLAPQESLRDPANRADMVVLAPPAFFSALRPLLDHRRQQGLETKVTTVEAVCDEFNQGFFHPEAIRSFLRYAKAHWVSAPKYVLLAGNGTYDYKDLRGHGDNLIPTLMVRTPYGLFASDIAFGDLDGDSAPEIAIGRLPARSVAELTGLIQKIVSYESKGRRWPPVALLVADVPDQAGDFVTDIVKIAAQLSASYVRRLAYPNVVQDLRQEIFARLQEGADLMCYVGHGAIDWLGGSKYLVKSDTPLLNNGERLPVVCAMTCLAGQFSVPGYDSLGESLVLAPASGAIAMISPTGLSYNDDAVTLNIELVRSLQNGHRSRLGDYVIDAMQRYNAGGMRATPCEIYNILGDPATRYSGALALPPALTIAIADRDVILSVSTVFGEAYSLWTASEIPLSVSLWVNLTNWVAGAELCTIKVDNPSNAAHRFYQVTSY